MSAPLELFVLTWGVYPRRVLLYLSERGLLSSPLIQISPVLITQEGMVAPDGKPAGTVPILKLPNGTFIKQSAAILEYLEDVCDNPDPQQEWQVELAKTGSTRGSMRGNTSEEKARVREILALADEATSQFGFACHKGCKLFMLMETTNALTAKLVLEFCSKNMKLLEAYYFEDAHLDKGGKVSIADCVLYSLLQFSKDLYHLDLLSNPELPCLKRFYDQFKKRDSAMVEEGHFPADVAELACQWLPLE